MMLFWHPLRFDEGAGGTEIVAWAWGCQAQDRAWPWQTPAEATILVPLLHQIVMGAKAGILDLQGSANSPIW